MRRWKYIPTLHLQYTTFSIFVKYFGKKICFFYENVENMQSACPLQRLTSALIFFCRYNYLFYFFYSFYCKGRRNSRVCLLLDCIRFTQKNTIDDNKSAIACTRKRWRSIPIHFSCISMNAIVSAPEGSSYPCQQFKVLSSH